ncbi:hypothetical protein DUI87_23873 [Hirundo rustica rustica]|uniref:Uncharacterized protein n=1 Tax=Hirundo rustica rustica TaxID=333673 RepID=A0A3M0JGW9_HIRRU|nr:hypothetical protein DUI87_23873 [Hirundo rustica rustica]
MGNGINIARKDICPLRQSGIKRRRPPKPTSPSPDCSFGLRLELPNRICHTIKGHAHRAYIRGAGPCAAQSQESTSLSRKQLPGHHSAFKERSDTEQDKANPDSQAPSPLPGWPADQALSGQWLRTGGGSGLPLSHTEEEGPLAKTENNMDPELSQRGDVTGQEITVEEFDPKQEEATIQEDSPCEAVRHQEWHQWEVGVRVQWGDGTQQELPMDRWVHPEEDEDAQSCAQQGPASPSSVGTLVAGDTACELPSTSPVPGSPTEDGPAPAAAAAAGAGEEVEESPEPVAPEVAKAPGSPACREEVPWAGTEGPLPAPRSPPGCCQALLDLARHISSQVVLQAVLEIQASGQQPEEQGHLGQSTAAELEAAATAEKEESPTSAPLSPRCPASPEPGPLGVQALSEQQEEAHSTSVPAEEESQEGALAEEHEQTQRKYEEDKELPQGEIKYHEGSQGEACIGQELSTDQSGSCHEDSKGEARIGQERSPSETPSNNKGSQGEACIGQELSPAESSSNQEEAQGEACIEQELSLEEAGSYHVLSDWDECTDQELSLGDAESWQEVSDWEEYTEQGLSQGEVGSSCNLSDWEEYSEHELSHSDVGTYQDVSDWEESLEQDPSQEGDTLAQKVHGGNEKRPSTQSSWENDSNQDPVQDSWEESIGTKAYLPEDDEWDNVSVLELLEDEDREPRLAGLAGGGFPVPVPREAWAEPCPRWPPYASPPHVEALTPIVSLTPRAFRKQVPEDGSLSQQRAPRKKRLSRLRRALRALRSLFRFPCLAPQPQD